MKRKYNISVIWLSALSMFSFFGLLKAIGTGVKWKIICAGIGFGGFLAFLILIIIQMIKEKRKKDI